jgi:benzoylformate decarboxylase
MREVVQQYLGQGLSRRGFLKSMTALGFSATAAEAVLQPLEASEQAGRGIQVPGAIDIVGTGGELVLAQAKAAGAEYMFCNPGSFESGFYDAFPDCGIQFVLGLHEGVVMSMADAYHRVSQKPAFVAVHVIAGTAQLAGQLYNASRDGSAVVITSGLNDNEIWSDDSDMGARPGYDQKEINRQFTKISWEARDARSFPLMMRRAFKVSATEPGGPVYLAMAGYAFKTKDVKGKILPAERFMLRAKLRADKQSIEKAARLLVEAKRPILVVGDEIWKSGAQAEVVSLSEKLGLPVATDFQSFRNFPTKHPHLVGGYRPDSELVQKGVDLIVTVGTRDFGREWVPETPNVPPDVPIVRVGVDPNAMGRTEAVDLAVISDVKQALMDIQDGVDSLATKERIDTLAKARSEEAKSISSARWERAEKEIRASLGKSPIHPAELGAVLAGSIDPNAIVIRENQTGKYDSFNFGFRDGEQFWLATTGYSLGWGIGAATGAKLAAPDRQVVCTIGDGATMYSASGFWTQVRYGVPVLTVLSNNHNYQGVRHAFHRYNGKSAASGKYIGMYLGEPEIDFVKLAESQGVSAEKVENVEDLRAALERGKAATRAGDPYLVEVMVSRTGGGADSTWHQEFKLAEKRTRKI